MGAGRLLVDGDLLIRHECLLKNSVVSGCGLVSRNVRERAKGENRSLVGCWSLATGYWSYAAQVRAWQTFGIMKLMYRTVSSLCMLSLLGANLSAQKVISSRQSWSVVRVRVEYVAPGMGGGAYKTSVTTVEPTFTVRELRNSPHPRKWPNRTQKRTLKKSEWQKLERAIDVHALASVHSQTCYAAIDVDNSCSTFEIDLADGQKIEIVFDESKIPAPIAAVLKNLPGEPVVYIVPPGSN